MGGERDFKLLIFLPMKFSFFLEEDEEFKSLRKKYYQVSKDIRMDAIEEEKKELGQSESSPKVKYYEGSKNDRIKLLDEIKRQMEELESISKGKK